MRFSLVIVRLILQAEYYKEAVRFTYINILHM